MPERSLDSQTIDLSLFAHIFNDAFLGGTFDLEGNSLSKTSTYLRNYLLNRAEVADSQEVRDFLARMSKLIEVNDGIQAIDSEHAGQSQDLYQGISALNELCNKLAREFLNRGETLTLPGGWLSKGGGHAMIYQLKKTSSGIEFYVHNSGAGLNYHEKKSTSKREEYYPTQTYFMPLPSEDALAWFLWQLLQARVPNLREGSDQSFDEKKLYEKVFPLIHYLDGELVPIEHKPAHAFTGGQLSGTCAERSLHKMLKSCFKSEEEYKKFIYHFKRHALNDYLQKSKENGEISDPRVQTQINHALDELLKLLKTPDLFDDAFIEEARKAILAVREEQKVLRKEILKAVPTVQPGPTVTTFTVGELPATSSLTIVPSSPKVTTTGKQSLSALQGGGGLLEQLTNIVEECQQLKASGQLTMIIEGLELLFARLPIPDFDHFGEPLAFYSDISDANIYELFQKIANLQTIYFQAVKSTSQVATPPRALAVNLSTLILIDYLMQQYPLDGQGDPNFNLSRLLSEIGAPFFSMNHRNPYFATNHPVLDERLQAIKTYYGKVRYNSTESHGFEYYRNIINTEPVLKRRLLKEFADTTISYSLRSALESEQCLELYILIANYDQISEIDDFAPLTCKFDLQWLFENAIFEGFEPFLITSFAGEKLRLTESSRHAYSGSQISTNSKLLSLRYSRSKKELLENKYPLPEGVVKKALTLGAFHDEYELQSERKDNHTQLFPGEMAAVKEEKFTEAQKKMLSLRQFERSEIAERELFHLRSQSKFQIQLTLDYFKQRLAKLNREEYQIYLEANLFEPGLLVNELKTNPNFLQQVDDFITAGIKESAPNGHLTQSSIFFIRLAYMVNAYIADIWPQKGLERLKVFQHQLEFYLSDTNERDPQVKHSLHQYQFLSSMSCFKYLPEPHDMKEEETILEQSFPAYFYMKARSNAHAYLDFTNQFQNQLLAEQFYRLIDKSDKAVIQQLITMTISLLELGQLISIGEPSATNPWYQIVVKKDQRQQTYTVDIAQGLLFNENGLAYAQLPLDLEKHPLRQFVSFKENEHCFVSSDGQNYVLGIPEPYLRFMRQGAEGKYRVQKQWIINGKPQWYELHALSAEQKAGFDIDSQIIELPLPDILKQRDSQIWVACDEPKHLLLTEHEKPSYQLSTQGGEQWACHQLDEQGMLTERKLCIGATWIHEVFSRFEAPEFVSITQQNETSYQVNFARYGLVLEGLKNQQSCLFRQKDHPHMVLIDSVSSPVQGVSCLTFEDTRTQQKTCYFPLQTFIIQPGQSAVSEFYNLQLDSSGQALKKVVKKLTEKSSTQLLPFQYTGHERMVKFSLDKDNQPIPQTAADALYLCYLYLGSQQPEKAWDVLEDCKKRFGGLEGNIEELAIISKIVVALPQVLEDKDNLATISTPSFTACRLKAMALLAESLMPDKKMVFPPTSFNPKTPDGLYHQTAEENLKKFYELLPQTLYNHYSRYQLMQEHLDAKFSLSDEERRSLLNYYHYSLPEPPPGSKRAIGALGYEWQRLQLKTLHEEYQALNSAREVKKQLPAAYEKRLREIERLLKEEDLVRRRETILERAPLNLSIPASLQIRPIYFYTVDKLDYWSFLIKKAWEQNFNIAGNIAVRGYETDAMSLSYAAGATEMFLHFPVYYRLVTSSNTKYDKDREQLLHYCRQYLMANRHTPAEKQQDSAWIFCNLLLRIHDNKQHFVKLESTFADWGDIYKEAREMPAPIIELYQIKDKTTDILAGASQIWSALDKDALTSSAAEVAQSCSLDAYNFEQLLTRAELDLSLRDKLFDSSQLYRAQAAVFGRPPTQVPKSDTDKLLSDGEREAGQQQLSALDEMKSIASTMLADPQVLSTLQGVAQQLIAELQVALDKLIETSIALANLGPSAADKKRRRDIEIESGTREPLTQQTLLALYFSADKAKYKHATGLDDAQIDILHTHLSDFVKMGTRCQALQRFCDKIQPADPSMPAPTPQEIIHELLNEDCVDHQQDASLAFFQYTENILLRPEQIAAIKRLLGNPQDDPYSFMESIEKMIMGGGKSKVILPLVVQNKATGTNLVVVEVPPSLFKTNHADLAAMSKVLFNKTAHSFIFHRDSDCSPGSLEYIYSSLINTIVHKDYLVTTGEAIQSLELKYLELLLTPPEKHDKRVVWEQQIEWMDKIVSLFRTRGDVIIDEVHQGLQFKKKLNYSLGRQQSIPSHMLHLCIRLYQFFETVPLDGELQGKFLSQILENNNGIDNDLQWQGMMASLVKALLEDPNSPLLQLLAKANITIDDSLKSTLKQYLLNQLPETPSFILTVDANTRLALQLLKEQFREYQNGFPLLATTLKAKVNVQYGASVVYPGRWHAIPYSFNEMPVENSRFSNCIASINYTIQLLLLKGISKPLLKEYLMRLQFEARQEFAKHPELGSLDKTEAGRLFATLETGNSLNGLKLDDEEQFNLIYEIARFKKSIIYDALEKNVLPQIQIDREVIHSDAYNHVDAYRSCQGVTGTPSNSRTFHQRLTYHKEWSAATDGFIYSLLKKKETQLRVLPYTDNLQEKLSGLFAGKDAAECIRAIIDIGAIFKGVDNYRAAVAIAEYIHKNSQQFSQPTDIKYILFFNDKNTLCALDLSQKTMAVIEVGSTDPAMIRQKLNCKANDYFTYYDQAHTLGTDIKQAAQARALVLVDHDTDLQSFFQGCMRMRGLQNEQSVEIIVPENYANYSLDALLEHMESMELLQLQQEEFTAAQAKMVNLVRNDLIKRILAVPSEQTQMKHELSVKFKQYFVEFSAEDFFKALGKISKLQDADKILTHMKDDLLQQWQLLVQSSGQDVAGSELQTMQAAFQKILDTALPACQGKQYPANALPDQDTQVQVVSKTQSQVAVQTQTQIQQVLYNPSLMPERSLLWSVHQLEEAFKAISDNKTEKRLLSVHELCQQVSSVPLGFGRIYASDNYFKTYKGQTPPFIDSLLKPVHAILFHQDEDGLISCIILSQEEAYDIASRLIDKLPNTWLTTTRHTILAGHRPDHVKENPSYQSLIEQARFFNGELVQAEDETLKWLQKDTTIKLDFLQEHLLPIRETTWKEIYDLQTSLLQRKRGVFRYLIEHALEDPAQFDWSVWNRDLDDEDIQECNALVAAIAEVNAHWQEPDFNPKQCTQSITMAPLTAQFFSEHLWKLESLRQIFYSEVRPSSRKPPLEPLLPILLSDFIAQEKTSPSVLLQYLIQQSLSESNMSAYLDMADYLVEQGVSFDPATSVSGQALIEKMVSSEAKQRVDLLLWVARQGITIQLTESQWTDFSIAALEQFIQLPKLKKSNTFLAAYLQKLSGETLENVLLKLFSDEGINVAAIFNHLKTRASTITPAFLQKVIEEGAWVSFDKEALDGLLSLLPEAQQHQLFQSQPFQTNAPQIINQLCSYAQHLDFVLKHDYAVLNPYQWYLALGANNGKSLLPYFSMDKLLIEDEAHRLSSYFPQTQDSAGFKTLSILIELHQQDSARYPLPAKPLLAFLRVLPYIDYRSQRYLLEFTADEAILSFLIDTWQIDTSISSDVDALSRNPVVYKNQSLLKRLTEKLDTIHQPREFWPFITQSFDTKERLTPELEVFLLNRIAFNDPLITGKIRFLFDDYPWPNFDTEYVVKLVRNDKRILYSDRFKENKSLVLNKLLEVADLELTWIVLEEGGQDLDSSQLVKILLAIEKEIVPNQFSEEVAEKLANQFSAISEHEHIDAEVLHNLLRITGRFLRLCFEQKMITEEGLSLIPAISHQLFSTDKNLMRAALQEAELMDNYLSKQAPSQPNNEVADSEEETAEMDSDSEDESASHHSQDSMKEQVYRLLMEKTTSEAEQQYLKELNSKSLVAKDEGKALQPSAAAAASHFGLFPATQHTIQGASAVVDGKTPLPGGK